MLDRNEALQLILKGCTENFTANDFEVKAPEGLEKDAAPIFEDGESMFIEIAKNDLTVRLVSHDNLLDIMEQNGDGDFAKVSSNLLDLEDFGERDIKSLINEIKDTVDSSYGKKSRKAAAQSKKAPATVSKTAVKNGMSYDANTLANRLTNVYPELKDAYKENFQKYDEFLGEDFFVNHANKYIMETLRGNDAQKIKKVMRILSDTYENGSNAVQDMVVVTILGEIDNDKELLEKCKNEITDEDFYTTLVAVNQYLASPAGKKAKNLLENPPKYKPKKEKKGFMSQMMEASMQQQPPQK